MKDSRFFHFDIEIGFDGEPPTDDKVVGYIDEILRGNFAVRMLRAGEMTVESLVGWNDEDGTVAHS